MHRRPTHLDDPRLDARHGVPKGMLPPLTSLQPLYFTRNYTVMLLLNVSLCVIINALIDFFVNRAKNGPTGKDGKGFPLFDGTTIANVFIFAIIVAVLIFGGGKPIQQRVKHGQAAGVTQESLRNTFFKRVFLFSMAHASWKKRLPLFILQCLLIPGIPVLFFALVMCTAAKRLEANDGECFVTLGTQVLFTELWKGAAIAFVFTVNYAATHNIEQREVQPDEEDEDGEKLN